jgi:hypothetical protein
VLFRSEAHDAHGGSQYHSDSHSDIRMRVVLHECEQACTDVVLRLRPQYRPEMPDATRLRYRDRGEPKAKGYDVDICM